MRGREGQDDELEGFIAARNQDLHHDAYQLAAAQVSAEQLVATVLADMRREHLDLTRAGADARLRMARTAARNDSATETDGSRLPERFHTLARLSPRQRAVLVLQVIDNYDERETARALRLSTRTVTSALRSIPYDDLPGAPPHTGELRSLLEDFGDLATSPSASTTLADVRAVPPPPRRPWWTYVATFLVVVLTVTTVVITQQWHKDWLQTPNGLNHAHGTHFPAYAKGYRLVGVRDVEPGPAETIDVGARGALVIECADGQKDDTAIARMASEIAGTYTAACSAPGEAHLTPGTGETLLAIDDFHRKEWPVATYRKLSWGEYPVVTSGFTVQTDKTLRDVGAPVTSNGSPMRPSVSGPVLTLRSHPGHLNGTFTGTLTVPPEVFGTELDVAGLLSPSSTGRYRIVIDHSSPWTTCGATDVVRYTNSRDRWCELYERKVPQITFFQPAPVGDDRTYPVTITVEHALRPWELQVVASRYKVDASAVDDGGNG